jgi:hypothetical protein
MSKFSSRNTFDSFIPVNNVSKFTPMVRQMERANSIAALISQFEKRPIENEVMKIQPEPKDTAIKQEAIDELKKDDDEIVPIVENTDPIIEITEIYPKENDIEIEKSIQNEIKLKHQGFRTPKMKLIVDEIVLNLRKKKFKENGWSN